MLASPWALSLFFGAGATARKSGSGLTLEYFLILLIVKPEKCAASAKNL
jgi:hypothetical protein